jgi:hypothetical protein
MTNSEMPSDAAAFKWRVVMNNEGASRIVAACLDEDIVQALSTDGCLNFMRLIFDPTRMRQRILNWTFVTPGLLARLRREAAGDALSPSSALLRELAPLRIAGKSRPNTSKLLRQQCRSP